MNKEILKSYQEAFKGVNVKKRIKSNYPEKELKELEKKIKDKYKSGK